MKKFNYFLTCSLVLCSILLFSCKKQIAEPVANDEVASVFPIVTSCKPVFFGVHETVGGGGSRWTTGAQKWYENGKVKYFKGQFSGASPAFGGYIAVEPQFNVEWGEVTHEGNQVYLRDVAKNRVVFRVTVDEMGKALASYLFNQTDNIDGSLMYDTTYYYYHDGTSKLDFVYRSANIRLYGNNFAQLVNTYKFNYDGFGNVTTIDGNRGSQRLIFTYDYSKRVTGIIPNYIFTTSFRLAEFLDLTRMPIHYAVTQTDYGTLSSTGVFQPGIQWKYDNYVIDGSGLVQSYHSQPGPNHHQTFYNGWDCGGTTVADAVVRSKYY